MILGLGGNPHEAAGVHHHCWWRGGVAARSARAARADAGDRFHERQVDGRFWLPGRGLSPRLARHWLRGGREHWHRVPVGQWEIYCAVVLETPYNDFGTH